jgi:hypothetical protein
VPYDDEDGVVTSDIVLLRADDENHCDDGEIAIGVFGPPQLRVLAVVMFESDVSSKHRGGASIAVGRNIPEFRLTDGGGINSTSDEKLEDEVALDLRLLVNATRGEGTGGNDVLIGAKRAAYRGSSRGFDGDGNGTHTACAPP